jgi:hypothetical protein
MDRSSLVSKFLTFALRGGRETGLSCSVLLFSVTGRVDAVRGEPHGFLNSLVRILILVTVGLLGTALIDPAIIGLA